MSLSLRLDNVDTLPDGGPVSFQVDRRGLDIGRDPYLDWTLPDAERFISGKHCEIRYRDGGYWLHDVSTNGTTLNGRPGRLTEPHRLQDGDRIHIGNYIVAVVISSEEDPSASGASGAPAASGAGADPWGGVADAAEAVDRRDFAAHARPREGQEAPRGPVDAAEENISWSVGQLTEGRPATDEDIWGASPASPAGGKGDEWGWASPAPEPDTPPSPASPRTPPESESERAPQDRDPPPSDPFAPASPDPDPAPPPVASPEPMPAPPANGREREDGAPAAAPAAGGDFIAAFERGAGMPAGSVAGQGAAEFAEELGALFRLVSSNLQAMLAARAETKSAMRSSERTMIGAMENNPLKFSPTPEDALRIMFGEKTRSYLDATGAIEQGFQDLQKHQMQTFVAMQQALQALIEDLDPEKIEQATAKDGGLAGMVGSRRAKFWDTYVERFRAKSGRHERGMIDAFMILFAETYDRQR